MYAGKEPAARPDIAPIVADAEAGFGGGLLAAAGSAAGATGGLLTIARPDPLTEALTSLTVHLIGAPALVFGAQTVSSPGLAPGAPNPLKFSATHNCNNIAAGGKCKITVTFTPGTGTKNQQFDVAMTVLSNAANGPQTVWLRGTRK